MKKSDYKTGDIFEFDGYKYVWKKGRSVKSVKFIEKRKITLIEHDRIHFQDIADLPEESYMYRIEFIRCLGKGEIRKI